MAATAERMPQAGEIGARQEKKNQAAQPSQAWWRQMIWSRRCGAFGSETCTNASPLVGFRSTVAVGPAACSAMANLFSHGRRSSCGPVFGVFWLEVCAAHDLCHLATALVRSRFILMSVFKVWV
jgi:hypothetical protein